MSAPFVPVTIAFLFGILLGPFRWSAPLGLVVGALSAALAIRRGTRERWSSVAVVVLWLCLGMLRMALWHSHPSARLATALSDEPKKVRLHGVVRDDPVQPFDPNDLESGGTSRRARPVSATCVVELLHAASGSVWRPARGRVRATVEDPRVHLAYGDELLAEGTWSRVPSPGNPGQYDWREALARQQIHGLFRAKAAGGVVIVQHRRANSVLGVIFRVRQRWTTLIRQTFNTQEAGLLLSLLLGQRVALDEHLKAAFVETGTIHMLVISGFNVGLVAWLLELCLRVMGWPWRWRWPFLIISLGGYCVLTGCQPPVVRAMLMAWIVLVAGAFDRVISWSNTLAAAALVILWLNPTQLFDPGFQLSFGAVVSLLVFTRRWSAWLAPRLNWLRPAGARRYVALSVSTTGAVWVGLAPVLAWYFHLVSPVSMLANLLIAPLMSALVWVGTSLLMVATVVDPALRWGHGVLSLLLTATLRSVSWCHRIPGGYWFVGQPSAGFLVGYYVLLGISLLRSRLGWTANRVLLCWVAALTVWLWSGVARNAVASRWLRVDILDVGHGDCLIVRTPRGQTLVVDAGSEEAGRSRVIPFLHFAGITTVDAVVLTHPDADHIGGAIPLLESIRVNRLLTNGVRDDTMSALRVQYLAASRRIQEVTLAGGMRLIGDSAVDVEVLHPPRGLVPGAAPASNDNSVVLKVTKGSVSFLLCGDIEEAGLPWLLRQGGRLRSSVLKVPHHGSRLGEVGERFFNTVQPAVAVLSVGRLHHLPAPDTVDALTRTGARIFSTRRDGAVSLRTDGTQLEVRTGRGRQRVMIRVSERL